jgi:uncharacterized membrane protein YcaP (DUF421 family)
MEFVKIIITSVGSVAALFLMTKLIGNKQMNQLNLFDYINGITIGSIGAELAITTEKDFWKPLVALIIYALATFTINLLAGKSIKLRRFLEGKSIILMENRKLLYENFKKSKIDLNEFLTLCRVEGYFDLNQIDTAIIEPNGRISFLPVENQRPVTPKDMNIALQQSHIQKCVIIDGEIMENNLKRTGFDLNYLKSKLKEQKLSKSDVFLGIGDNSGVFTFYKYETAGHPDDPFQ